MNSIFLASHCVVMIFLASSHARVVPSSESELGSLEVRITSAKQVTARSTEVRRELDELLERIDLDAGGEARLNELLVLLSSDHGHAEESSSSSSSWRELHPPTTTRASEGQGLFLESTAPVPVTMATPPTGPPPVMLGKSHTSNTEVFELSPPKDHAFPRAQPPEGCVNRLKRCGTAAWESCPTSEFCLGCLCPLCFPVIPESDDETAASLLRHRYDGDDEMDYTAAWGSFGF